MGKNILACATHGGAVNAINPVIRELTKRKYSVDVYATGNKAQAKAFGDIPYQHGPLSREDCYNLLTGRDLVLVGTSSTNTAETYFLKAAAQRRVPSVAVPDLFVSLAESLGTNPDFFPTIFSAMNIGCLDKIREVGEFSSAVAEELIRRTRITGWTIYDHFASLRESFSEARREILFAHLGLNPDREYPFHPTAICHPDTDYMKSVDRPRQWKENWFDYEHAATEGIFQIASDLGLKLVVKPHPGEKFETNFTLDLVKKFDFVYIPAAACDTKQLMLSASSVTGGRTTCIVDSCIFGKPTGGLFPDLSPRDVAEYPSVTTDAIPYTFEWDKVGEIFKMINSKNPATIETLRKARERFSVDGNASKRLVDIIEKEIF